MFAACILILLTKTGWRERELNPQHSITASLAYEASILPLDYPAICLVGVVGIEPTCDQLLFRLLIRQRRYTPIYQRTVCFK